MCLNVWYILSVLNKTHLVYTKQLPVGRKPVGRNDGKAAIFYLIALVLTVYYMTEYYSIVVVSK